MSTAKEKVRLTEAQETLLITLYAKARGCPEDFFHDETARRILDQVLTKGARGWYRQARSR